MVSMKGCRLIRVWPNGCPCNGNWAAVIGCGVITGGPWVSLLHPDILDVQQWIGLLSVKVLVTEPVLSIYLSSAVYFGLLMVVCVSGIHFDGIFGVCWMGCMPGLNGHCDRFMIGGQCW